MHSDADNPGRQQESVSKTPLITAVGKPKQETSSPGTQHDLYVIFFFLWTSSNKMISSMGELISVVFLEAIVNLLNQINYCQLKTVCTFELLTAFENERIINDNNYFSTQLKIALYFILFFFF